MSLGHLQGDEVVLVVSGDGNDCVSALDAGLRKKLHLATVAAHDDAAELRLEPIGAAAVLLDERDLMAAVEEVARKVVADCAASDHENVQALLLQQRLFDAFGAVDGGTDGVQAKLLV